MADHVFWVLPSSPLDDLSRRAGAVHCVGRHQKLTVRRPAQSKNHRGRRTLQTKKPSSRISRIPSCRVANLWGNYAIACRRNVSHFCTNSQEVLQPKNPCEFPTQCSGIRRNSIQKEYQKQCLVWMFLDLATLQKIFLSCGEFYPVR